MSAYEITTLPNGIRVVAIPLKERKSVSVGIWIHAGGRDENEKNNGVSHFLEHIVFKGTPSRTANQIKESVEGVGGSFNAFTSEECTCFLAKTASKHFPKVFEVLSDMVLNASLKESDIEKERTVIMEEIKMTQDQPAHLVEELLAQTMWPGHALGRPITGTLETVEALTREEISSYKTRFYAPHLITVVAAGNVTQAALVSETKKHFSANGNKMTKNLSVYSHSQAKTALKIFNKSTEQTHIAIGLPTFGKEHPDEYALDMLSVILGGNMSSRLFNEVREERGLAYDIGTSMMKYHETGAFVVSAGIDNHKLNDAIKVILQELKKITKESVGKDELVRAKEFYLGQLDLGLENSMNTMLWVGENLVGLGRCRTSEEVAQKVEKVSAEDLQRVAEGLFKNQSLNMAVVGPLEKSAESQLGALLTF
jgi:predicted Zn-dependent peptidase